MWKLRFQILNQMFIYLCVQEFLGTFYKRSSSLTFLCVDVFGVIWKEIHCLVWIRIMISDRSSYLVKWCRTRMLTLLDTVLWKKTIWIFHAFVRRRTICQSQSACVDQSWILQRFSRRPCLWVWVTSCLDSSQKI